jgi:amino acid transporter
MQSMATPATETVTPSLRPAVGRSGFFTLALGAIVGSGWVVVLGDWLGHAGPAGAIIGFLLGGVSMVCIGLCYGELAARFSRAGGEFLYTLETLGPLPGFLVGWFLTLFAISVCAFEAVVVGSLLRALMGRVHLAELYSVAGYPITIETFGAGIMGALLIGYLHLRGADFAIRFQNVVTYGFLVMMIVLVAIGIALGDTRNLQPLFASQQESFLPGWIWVFSTCAFFLNGWQTSLHALEERATGVTVASAVRAMVSGVFAGALLYCALILAAGSAVPWQSLVGDEMPAKTAFGALGPSGALGVVVLVAALISATKTWSAVAWVGSRLIVAQARRGFLPQRLAGVNVKSGAPSLAIVVVTALTFLGPTFGRSAILPLVSMVSICLALSILLCLVVLIRLRSQGGPPPAFRVPGGAATIGIAFILALSMIGIAIADPLIMTGTIPLEWYLLAGWGLLGVAMYALIGRKAR